MVKRSQLKRLAKQQLKRNWGIALGAITLCSAMSVAALIIGGPALANVVSVGFVAAYMAIIRTGKANISSVFDGWKSFGPACKYRRFPTVGLPTQVQRDWLESHLSKFAPLAVIEL